MHFCEGVGGGGGGEGGSINYFGESNLKMPEIYRTIHHVSPSVVMFCVLKNKRFVLPVCLAYLQSFIAMFL